MGPGRLTLRKRTSIANELCFFHKDLFLYFSVNILLRGRKSTFIKNNRLLRFTMATMLWKLLWPVSSEKAEQTHIRQEYITVNLLRLTAYYIFYIEFFFKESAKTPNTLSTFTIFNEFHKKNFEPQFRWCNNSTHLAMRILLKNVLRWPVKIIFGELSTIWENKWNCGVLVKLLNFNKLSPPRMYFLSI